MAGTVAGTNPPTATTSQQNSVTLIETPTTAQTSTVPAAVAIGSGSEGEYNLMQGVQALIEVLIQGRFQEQ
jgi:hypothetical protein